MVGVRRDFLLGTLLGIFLCLTLKEQSELLHADFFDAKSFSWGIVVQENSSNATPSSTIVTSGIYDAIKGNHVRKAVPPIINGSQIGGYPDYGGCIISDRLQFIYIKTAKSAGSTILLGWIRPSLCPAKNDTDVFTGWGVKASSRVSKSCDASIVYPPPGTHSSNCQDIPLWKWEQYFVFATVRNPYSRMRSAYTYCKQTDFCRDPKATNGCDNGQKNKNGDGHANDAHYQFPVHWAYHGWWRWHVDYLIRVEDLDPGIAEVAAIVNDLAAARGEELRLQTGFKSVNVRQKPAAQEKAELCRWFTGQYSQCAVALKKTMDPHVLGYPDYCREE